MARATDADVTIIGAGPAGSLAGATLSRAGRSVVCLERGHFPRHVIGESLLPRCNALLDTAGLLRSVEARGYMIKRGAVFLRGEDRERFDFGEALPGDRPSTFQVPRDDFDQLLALEARRAGLDLRFGHSVEAVDFDRGGAVVRIRDVEEDRPYDIRTRFVLDCSGFGRVLPRLLDLEQPAPLPRRVSCFTQVEGDARPEGDLEGDIWICIHPVNGWIWIIPFSNGRTSVGMVCDSEHWEQMEGSNRSRLLRRFGEEPNTARRLTNAVPVAQTRCIEGYSRQVKALHGDSWALVGNASDFLDPVFSSGVTLALESATLASGLVERALRGEGVRWDLEYDRTIRNAVGVFLVFVEAWYRRDLETVFFASTKLPRMKRLITSILGGHVLRQDNPLVDDARSALRDLSEAVSSLRAPSSARRPEMGR